MTAVMLITSWLLRIYPAQWRADWASDYLSTFRASCQQVRAAAGPLAVLRHVIAEWVDAVRGAFGARRGELVTGGVPPRRDRRRRESMTSALRTGARSLRASPGHTAIAVITLALGIGVNAGLFSVLDSLLIRPMPFAHGNRLVELHNHSIKGGVTFPGMDAALTERWREQTDLFDRVETFSSNVAMYEGPEGIELDDMAYVTPELLTMLGVPPALGRLFSSFRGTAPDEVLLSERVWRSTFGSRPDMVGSTLVVNGRSLRVVGLMPASFHFPSNGTELWQPLGTDSAEARSAYVLARLASGRQHDAVAAAVTERGSRLQVESGGDAGVTATVYRRSDRDARQVRSLQVLAGAVAFLLLIVCANLSNLALTKALSRARDAGVRAALGASRGDLVREGLAEQLLIGVMGAVAGVIVAAGVVALAAATLPPDITLHTLNSIDLDTRTLLLIAALGLTTPLLFGLPAVWLRGSTVAGALSLQSRGSTLSRTAVRWRNVMVVAEVALALVLLTGAALMARSVYSLVNVDRGFDAEGLVTVTVGLPSATYQDPGVRDAWSDRVLAEVRRAPGISAVTIGGVPPRPSGQNFGRLEFAHRSGEAFGPMALPVYRVWPDYFDTIRLRLVAGRAFTATEAPDSIIVSESFARRFWPNQSAVGGQFRFTGTSSWSTVVGVARDVRQNQLDDGEGTFEVFRPLRAQAPSPRRGGSQIIEEHRTIVARAENEGAGLAALRQIVRRIDPSVVLWSSGTVEGAFSNAIAQPRLILDVLAALGFLGVTLAAAGLYGVLSYLVATRAREFGLRMALGARPASVFNLILRHGLTLTLVGVVAGGCAALALVQVMQSLLYDVESSDPTPLAGVALLLCVVAGLAAWSPARRAMRVDPVILLRD
jgi:predicted permease